MARPDRSKWEGDAYYDVWAMGGDPDAIDFECRGEDAYYAGDEAEWFAQSEVARQDERRRQREAEEDYGYPEPEYPEPVPEDYAPTPRPPAPEQPREP